MTIPLGSGASSFARVLSAGLPRRWAVDRCQADRERDQRARGAKEDRHHHDEQPPEQRLPGGVPQPRKVQERSEESEQDDYARPHSTRMQERRRLPEIDHSDTLADHLRNAARAAQMRPCRGHVECVRVADSLFALTQSQYFAAARKTTVLCGVYMVEGASRAP